MQEWKPLLKIMMQTNEQYINKYPLNVERRNIHR